MTISKKLSSRDPRVRTEGLVEAHARGVLGASEVADSFVFYLAELQAFDAVEECIQILPASVVCAVQAIVADLGAREYPGYPTFEWRDFQSKEEREACYQKMHLAYQEVCTRLEAYWRGEPRAGEGSIHDV